MVCEWPLVHVSRRSCPDRLGGGEGISPLRDVVVGRFVRSEQWQEREQSQEPERRCDACCFQCAAQRLRALFSGCGSAMAFMLAAWGFYGDRWMIRAQEIAAVDRAQRILRGEGSSRLWMSLARCLLSQTRRDLAVSVWAAERGLVLGLVLYETSSGDEG